MSTTTKKYRPAGLPRLEWEAWPHILAAWDCRSSSNTILGGNHKRKLLNHLPWTWRIFMSLYCLISYCWETRNQATSDILIDSSIRRITNNVLGNMSSNYLNYSFISTWEFTGESSVPMNTPRQSPLLQREIHRNHVVILQHVQLVSVRYARRHQFHYIQSHTGCVGAIGMLKCVTSGPHEEWYVSV